MLTDYGMVFDPFDAFRINSVNYWGAMDILF